MHYAIHKLHWSPSQIREWLDSDMEMKAAYYGSTKLKIEHDKKEIEEIKRKSKQ
jgi:hypothetical protein